MARKLRVEYPGTNYHVMNRGDHRDPIVRDDDDRREFLRTLAETCVKTTWAVHEYCLIAAARDQRGWTAAHPARERQGRRIQSGAGGETAGWDDGDAELDCGTTAHRFTRALDTLAPPTGARCRGQPR